MHNSAGNFAVLIGFQCELNFQIGDVLVGEQVGSEGVVGWFGDGLLQTGDVGGVGGETQGEAFVADVGVVAFQFLVGNW